MRRRLRRGLPGGAIYKESTSLKLTPASCSPRPGPSRTASASHTRNARPASTRSRPHPRLRTASARKPSHATCVLSLQLVAGLVARGAETDRFSSFHDAARDDVQTSAPRGRRRRLHPPARGELFAACVTTCHAVLSLVAHMRLLLCSARNTRTRLSRLRKQRTGTQRGYCVANMITEADAQSARTHSIFFHPT